MWCCFAWDLLAACKKLRASDNRLTYEIQEKRRLESEAQVLMDGIASMHTAAPVFTDAMNERLNRRLRDKLYGQTCPITLEIIADYAVLNCGHVFERAAYMEWSKTSSSCPLCRKQCRLLNRI